jgi:7-carboxy-7-deazaguanine synthase
MKVNEIFYSIEGEGIRAGLPCVFIRLYGCNLNCSYCDTRYSCEDNEYREMSIYEIIEEVKKYNCPNITVTGGEPLMHEGVDILLEALKRFDFNINVETNGSIMPRIKDILYTVDYKTFSSGMTSYMNKDAFTCLTENDVIKFVVGSIDDLEQAKAFIEEIKPRAHIFVSPIFGKIEAAEIAEYLKNNSLNNWRHQLQMHKYIWKPTERGV